MKEDYLDHLHINRVNIPLGHGAKARVEVPCLK